jgi:hypothetical protein
VPDGIAGGTNLIPAPEVMIGLSKARMLSPWLCRTFDAGANGIVRGEGCGVVLKGWPMRSPMVTTLAVSRGPPSTRWPQIYGAERPAQESVIREALERSGMQLADIDYVETHGTRCDPPKRSWRGPGRPIRRSTAHDWFDQDQFRLSRVRRRLPAC